MEVAGRSPPPTTHWVSRSPVQPRGRERKAAAQKPFPLLLSRPRASRRQWSVFFLQMRKFPDKKTQMCWQMDFKNVFRRGRAKCANWQKTTQMRFCVRHKQGGFGNQVPIPSICKPATFAGKWSPDKSASTAPADNFEGR